MYYSTYDPANPFGKRPQYMVLSKYHIAELFASKLHESFVKYAKWRLFYPKSAFIGVGSVI
jgi:hypothetical protein